MLAFAALSRPGVHDALSRLSTLSGRGAWPDLRAGETAAIVERCPDPGVRPCPHAQA
jgi:hypothetical protein